MATTCFFEKKIRCIGGKDSMQVEVGRTSYYGTDGLYLKVNDEHQVVMNKKTATEFLAAVQGVWDYLYSCEESEKKKK